MAVSGMVEESDPAKAPSKLAAVGQYILYPVIFSTPRSIECGTGGEVQLTDATARDADTVPLTAFRFSGIHHGCGIHDGLPDAACARLGELKGHRDRVAGPLAMARGLPRLR